MIWNRGSSTNVWNVSHQQARLDGFGIEQLDTTPTGGYCIVVGSNDANTIMQGGWIEHNFCNGEYGLLYVNQGVEDWVIAHNLFYGGSGVTTVIATVDNTSPAGDIKWLANSFTGTGIPCVTFVHADTDVWTGNKFNQCSPMLSGLTSGNVIHQNFVGNSFEGTGGSSATMISISAGNGFMFTGNEFAIDNGHGIFNLSGSVDDVTITGNILQAGVTGAPFTNTSSGTNISYIGNTDSAEVTTIPGSFVISTGELFLPTSTIGSLSTCSGVPGAMAVVTNGIASPTFHQTVSTTGSTTWPVFCNGTNWVYN